MSALSKSRRSLRGRRHHLPIFVLTVTLSTMLYVTRPYRDVISRASFATAYPALLLLALTLALGPWCVWRAPRVPVSFDLRRDVGIWAGILSILHAVLGQMVHFRGRPWLYYVYPANSHHATPFRADLFGGANETGLVATLVVIALLATSNDVSLRRMGTPQWKRLQRFNYVAFALAGVHTFLYLSIEKSLISGWALLTGLCLTATAATQLTGYVLRRRRTTLAMRQGF